MKKRFNNVILIVVLMLFFSIRVDAATCDSKTKNNLKKEALQVSISINLNKPTSENGADNSIYSYDLSILNASKNLSYKVGDWFYYYEESKDNTILLKNAYMMGGYKGIVKIYGSATSGCEGIVLRTISLYIPYYNKYSEREECNDYKEYNICKSNYNAENISEEDFLKRLEKIKQNLNSQQNEKPDEQKENFFNHFLDIINQNKTIIIIFSIILVLLIAAIIIIRLKKNKNKIKIDLGDDL